MENKVPCPKCLGSGDIVTKRGNHSSVFQTMKCTFCMGSKEVDADREKEYTSPNRTEESSCKK